MDQQALAEYRYRAVREVPTASPISSVRKVTAGSGGLWVRTSTCFGLVSVVCRCFIGPLLYLCVFAWDDGYISRPYSLLDIVLEVVHDKGSQRLSGTRLLAMPQCSANKPRGQDDGHG